MVATAPSAGVLQISPGDRTHFRGRQRGESCLICGRKPSDPHRLRHVQPRALGRKGSDEFAVPLCLSHHRAVHRAGDERAWWQTAGVDPLKAARKLWKHTRVNEGQIRLERTGRAIDSDILSTKDGKTRG